MGEKKTWNETVILGKRGLCAYKGRVANWGLKSKRPPHPKKGWGKNTSKQRIRKERKKAYGEAVQEKSNIGGIGFAEREGREGIVENKRPPKSTGRKKNTLPLIPKNEKRAPENWKGE